MGVRIPSEGPLKVFIMSGFNTTQAKTLDSVFGELDSQLLDVSSIVAGLQTNAGYLTVWAVNLADKLNNDAGVADTDYSTSIVPK